MDPRRPDPDRRRDRRPYRGRHGAQGRGTVGHPLRRPVPRPARGAGGPGAADPRARDSRDGAGGGQPRGDRHREPAHAGHELRPGGSCRIPTDEDHQGRRRAPRLPGDRGPRPRRRRGAAGDGSAGPVALLDRAHGGRLHERRDPAVLRPLRRHQGHGRLRDAVPGGLPARLRRRLVAPSGAGRDREAGVLARSRRGPLCEEGDRGDPGRPRGAHDRRQDAGRRHLEAVQGDGRPGGGAGPARSGAGGGVRPMRFFEYESRAIVKRAGIPVTDYGFARTAQEAREIAERIGGPVVIKSQVLSGGRMKAGGVKFADTPDEAAGHAEAILRLEIGGHMPRGVLGDPRAEGKHEYYAGEEVDAMDHRGVAGNVTEFDGNLGLVIGAGGGSLTLFDAVRAHGGRPANYCEIGGNPSVRKAAGLAKLVLQKPGVDKIAVMMSIVSNTRVDIVARGVIKACLELGYDPAEKIAIFRIPGAWEDEAYNPGPIGVISRSGGMTTEMSSTLTAADLGQSTAVSIGGDAIIGSTYAELMPLFEADEQTEAIVIYTEPGGRMEAQLARHVTETDSKLPIVAFMAGRFMDEMPGMSFGHAGTIVEGKEDTAAEKIARLAEAGITVAEDIAAIPTILESKMRDVLERPEADRLHPDAGLGAPPGG